MKTEDLITFSSSETLAFCFVQASFGQKSDIFKALNFKSVVKDKHNEAFFFPNGSFPTQTFSKKLSFHSVQLSLGKAQGIFKQFLVHLEQLIDLLKQ